MSTETKTEPHRIEWRIQRYGYVTARVICEAQVGAYCRTYCAEDCETACDHDEVSGPCFLLPWFDDTSMIPETYDGPDDTQVHDGPIVIAVSRAEEVSWKYAEAVAAPVTGPRETHAEKRARLRPVAEVLARYAWDSHHEEAAIEAEGAGLTVEYDAFDDLGAYRERLVDDQFHAARHLDNAGLIAKPAGSSS